MEARGVHKPRRRAVILSLALIALAVLVTALVVNWSRPGTDDAIIDADVVHMAPAVGGRLIALPVKENDWVRKGDLLFQIDPVPYQHARELAAANLSLARARLEDQRRIIDVQRSNAAIAGKQARKAQTNLGLSSRTADRLRPLSQQGYVPTQQLDQAEAAKRDAMTSALQAQDQARAADRAVDNIEAAEAAVEAATAGLANAQHALDETTVRAPHDGHVVGLTIETGEMVLPNQALFTLVVSEEAYAIANIREYDLHQIAIGDCATVYSMLDRGQPIRGVVVGIGWGVTDVDIIHPSGHLPYVQPSLNWVRVAHRFPVRIRLENPPPALIKVGASASVEVRHGAACR